MRTGLACAYADIADVYRRAYDACPPQPAGNSLLLLESAGAVRQPSKESVSSLASQKSMRRSPFGSFSLESESQAPTALNKDIARCNSLLAPTALNKDISNVQIVERKGEVVVWGPTGRNDKKSAPLPRIICYGDSNTVGYCNDGHRFEPYGKTMASELALAGMPCEVSVCGLCAYTTEDMLREKDSACVRPHVGPSGRGLRCMLDENGPADLVIIMTGTNDLGFHTPLPTILQHVMQLHAICHERGIPTVAVAATQGSGPACRAMRQRLADMIARWAKTSKFVFDFLDVEDLVPRPVGKEGASNYPGAAKHWEKDDIHLSAAGSVKLGRRLAPLASTWLKKLPTWFEEVYLVEREKLQREKLQKGHKLSKQMMASFSHRKLSETAETSSTGPSHLASKASTRSPLSLTRSPLSASRDNIMLSSARGCGYPLVHTTSFSQSMRAPLSVYAS